MDSDSSRQCPNDGLNKDVPVCSLEPDGPRRRIVMVLEFSVPSL